MWPSSLKCNMECRWSSVSQRSCLWLTKSISEPWCQCDGLMVSSLMMACLWLFSLWGCEVIIHSVETHSGLSVGSFLWLRIQFGVLLWCRTVAPRQPHNPEGKVTKIRQHTVLLSYTVQYVKCIRCLFNQSFQLLEWIYHNHTISQDISEFGEGAWGR